MYKEDIKIHYDINHEPRKIQIDALEFTKKQIRRGKKFIMLNMPTGSGKSMYSMMFINWYINYINEDAKFDLLTNSKILQRQYTDEFPYIASLKGKNAYRCKDYPNASCQEGKEMNLALKRTCSDCPYDKALLKWKTSRVTLTNFHLFDAVSLFLPNLLLEKKPNVLIIDEAHDFESVLCDYISNKISKISLKMLGFSETKILSIFNSIKKIKHLSDLVYYIENDFLGNIKQLQQSIETKVSNPSFQMKDKVKFTKNLGAIKGALLNYNSFLDDYKVNPDNWVVDIEQVENSPFYKNFNIQPVWSDNYLKKIIWDKFDHVIFMSGTILSKDIFSTINGVENKLSAYYDVDTPFPLKNRPIYYIKAGKMTFHQKVHTFEKQKVYIDKIIKKNKNNKGIIHTGNYEIAKWVEDYYKDNDRFIFHDSNNRDESLQRHFNSSKPTIIVSPSMITGVDLKDDLSRFQIVLKIPYPNISSAKIKKRMETNKEWYNMKTVADFIQGIGRSVRSIDDYADTFVLDSSFGDILRHNYKYFPHYIIDAIKPLK